MLRRLSIPMLVLAALVAAAPASGTAVGPVSVRLLDCSVDDASATFYGRMKTIEGSDRMAMRFKLFEKQFQRFAELKATGLSRWHRSKPGVGTFGYRQELRGLRPGGEYRMQVTYRWYDEEGELLGQTRRRSAPCRQYEDALPNLTSSVVGAERTKVPGVLRYLLEISNDGVADATGAELRLAVDGSTVDTLAIPLLAPGETRSVAIRGPACTRWVESSADPDGVIAESSEQDNAGRVACSDLQRP